MGIPSRIENTMHWAATHELLTQTCSANDPAGFSL